MRRFIILNLVVLMILLTSSACSEFFRDCVEGNGRTATVRRVVDDFSNVASYGDFIVNVSTGSPTSVSVEADENLLQYIETYIQGNTLVIETKNNWCIRSSNHVYVDIVTPDIYELKLAGSGVINCNNPVSEELKYVLEGSGDIRSNGIAAETINAVLSGSGEIILEGTADQSDFLISGSGNIKSINLMTKKCIATISGSGNIYTYAEEILNVLIDGSGNVVYKGNPEKTVVINGSGRVIQY